MKPVIIRQTKSGETSSSMTLRPSTSLSPAALLVPASSIPSSSAVSTNPSTPNFETIYFPLKEECADDNIEISRDENPLGEKNKSELSRKIGNKNIQPTIQVVSSVASKKGVEPPIIPSQKKILPAVPSVSAPVAVLTSLTQPQRPKTRHLRKILPKEPPGHLRGRKPIILKSQSAPPVSRSVLPKFQDVPPTKQSIIQKSQNVLPGKQPIIKKSHDSTAVKQIYQKPQETTPPISAGVCLRWKNYHSYMQNTFPSLLDSEDFVDVTLACEGKSLKCHKIILSSCSDYLAYLLRENPCPHPIILMKDVKFWEIEALVQYMYKGEAHVPHEQLSELLNAAKALGIKGLADFKLDETPKEPLAVPQSEPKTLHKSSLPQDQKDPSSAVPLPSSQLDEKRATKRSLETGETGRVVKIRLRRRKSPILRAESPEIKYEPIDLPPSPIDNIPDDNYDDIVQDSADLEEIHEDDDPGGNESMEASDCADGNRKVGFIGNEFLDDEDIFRTIEPDSSRKSLVDDTKIDKISANNVLRTIDDDSVEETVEDTNVNRNSKEKDET